MTPLKEHPILFTPPMVCAILEGRKTQTRRIIRLPKIVRDPDDDVSWIKSFHQDGAGDWIAWSSNAPYPVEFTKKAYPGSKGIICPYGHPGDRLWVREKWWPYIYSGSLGSGIAYYASYPHNRPAPIYHELHHELQWAKPDERARQLWKEKNQWRASIHMPRWASRLTLEVVNIRVERVQEISEDDAKAEGIVGHTDNLGSRHSNPTMIYPAFPEKDGGFMNARQAFECLWDSINAKRGYGWDANPWVWVVEFRKL